MQKRPMVCCIDKTTILLGSQALANQAGNVVVDVICNIPLTSQRRIPHCRYEEVNKGQPLSNRFRNTYLPIIAYSLTHTLSHIFVAA